MKPIPPPTPSRFTDRKTSRTDLTGLKPAEDFSYFFPLLLSPSSFLSFFLFYSFFLPSFLYFFILIFVKIHSSFFPSIFFYSFFLPSFLSFSIPFSFLTFFFLSFFPPFPTGETIKPGALKRPELDPNRGILITEIVRQISLCYSRELASYCRFVSLLLFIIFIPLFY